MADGRHQRHQRKIICGSCGERVLEGNARDVFRTMDDGGFMRFRDHRVPGSTLTQLCPACYREWDVEADGSDPPPNDASS